MRWMMNTRMSKTDSTNSNVADGGIDVNENRRNTVAERTVAMMIRRRVAVEVPIRHGVVGVVEVPNPIVGADEVEAQVRVDVEVVVVAKVPIVAEAVVKALTRRAVEAVPVPVRAIAVEEVPRTIVGENGVGRNEMTAGEDHDHTQSLPTVVVEAVDRVTLPTVTMVLINWVPGTG